MIVRHKLTNEIMTVKKVNGSVAVCYLPKPYYNAWNTLIDICVCLWVNLEVIEEQLKLEI